MRAVYYTVLFIYKIEIKIHFENVVKKLEKILKHWQNSIFNKLTYVKFLNPQRFVKNINNNSIVQDTLC
ncbi:hypothetical protein B0O79_1508 [Flavobacteriaceae bacterium MAR_2009_75]|nr:hypothetical protein B0O79_1508 [Flavobacteriaceae bacterium MAR_2009_75]